MPIPRVSIIIPVYNNAQHIGRCLRSIFKQSFQDYEIIVVNDGSTDDLSRVLAEYQNKIKLIQQSHQGAAVARNYGWRQSNKQSRYLLFCDSDVKMKKKMLAVMVQILAQQPTKSFVYCSFRYGNKVFRLSKFNTQKLKKINYIPTTSLIRRQDFPGFDEAIKRFQDWDLWLTMAEQGKQGIRAPGVLFSVRAGGRISRWLPKIFYQIPWHKFGLQLKTVDDYNQAKKIIQRKHHLTS